MWLQVDFTLKFTLLLILGYRAWVGNLKQRVPITSKPSKFKGARQHYVVKLPKSAENIITIYFKRLFQAIVVEHQNHSDCCRCQTGERPVIQKNETTNAVLEEMKQTKKFQTKN